MTLHSLQYKFDNNRFLPGHVEPGIKSGKHLKFLRCQGLGDIDFFEVDLYKQQGNKIQEKGIRYHQNE
jgi:hypothetical protein